MKSRRYNITPYPNFNACTWKIHLNDKQTYKFHLLLPDIDEVISGQTVPFRVPVMVDDRGGGAPKRGGGGGAAGATDGLIER
jgi:hypothetical protein